MANRSFAQGGFPGRAWEPGGQVPSSLRAEALNDYRICWQNGMDFLLTWNCTHIANAAFRPVIESECRSLSYQVPVICTPEELIMG